METVVLGQAFKTIVEGDIIRTDKLTLLGGAEKSGCTVSL